jgi:hypothetical protein
MAIGAVPAFAMTIDNFNTVQTVTQTGIGTNGVSASGVGDAVFGERYIEATVTAGSAMERVSSSGLNPGQLAHSQDAGVTGNSLVVWDGDSSNGPVIDLAGTSVDVTDGGLSDSLIILIASNDWPTNLTFRFFTTLMDYSEFIYATPGVVMNLPVYLPLANFTGIGSGADFSDIRAISMSIGDSIPHEDLDLRLELLGTGTQSITEPATLGLFGAGLFGTGLVAKRRRNKGGVVPSAT